MSCSNTLRSRFDERARLVGAILIMFTVALLVHCEAAFVAWVLAIFFKLCTPRRAHFWKRLGTINLFVGMMWLFTPFCVPGPGLYSWGPFIASEGGFVLTMTLTFKANAVFMFFDALAGGMKASEFARALSGLHVPDKLTSLLLLTARQIDGFQRTKTQLEEAAKLRGFKPSFSMHTYRTLASFVATLFLRSFNRAEVLNEALKLRGFTGKWPTVHYHALKARDWFYVFAMGSLAGMLALFDIAMTMKWIP